MSEIDHEAAVSAYDQLEAWLKTRHPDYENRLACRDVEGAGRGMFAEGDVAPGETLLHIPSSALLNPLSLRSCPSNTIPLHLFPLSVSSRSGNASASSNRLKGRKQVGSSSLPRARSLASASTSARVSATNTQSSALELSGSTSTPTADASKGSDTSPPQYSSNIPSGSSNRKRPRLSIASRLNTTQLLSLHLLLTRDPAKRHPSGWEVYIRTLPDFDTHPLSWLYPARNGNGKAEDISSGGSASIDDGATLASGAGGGKGVWSWYGESGDDVAAGVELEVEGTDEATNNRHDPKTRLDLSDAKLATKNGSQTGKLHPLDCLTRGAREKLKDVQERYEGDKAAILTVLRAEEPFKSQGIVHELYEHDLLWAWLNVNTRSVSIPLGFQNTTNNTQNHTLVPILDMLNHSSDADRVIAAPRQVPSAPSIAVTAPAGSAPSTFVADARASPAARTGPTPLQPNGRPLPQNRAPNGTSSAKSGPTPISKGQTSGALVPGRIGLKLVAPARGSKAGEEVMFTYGPHCSSTLFAEYGFSELTLSRVLALQDGEEAQLENSKDDSPSGSTARSSPSSTSLPSSTLGMDVEGQGVKCNWADLMNGQLDVGHLVDEMWDDLSEEDREERESALRMIGCHQRNTLHTYRPPPSPSHSLLMTLRLLHHPTPIPSLRLRAIQSGNIAYFGPEVEDKVNRSLRTICERVVQESTEGLERTRRLLEQERSVVSGDQIGAVDGYTLQQLEALWIEQGCIAEAVMQRLTDGDTEW